MTASMDACRHHLLPSARLFSPQKIQEIQPYFMAVDTLLAFPFFDQCTIDNLKAELPNYMAAVEDICPTYDPMEFGKTHERSLSSWSQATQKVLVVQPLSAASGHQQNNALQDYIKTSLMLQYKMCCTLCL